MARSHISHSIVGSWSDLRKQRRAGAGAGWASAKAVMNANWAEAKGPRVATVPITSNNSLQCRGHPGTMENTTHTICLTAVRPTLRFFDDSFLEPTRGYAAGVTSFCMGCEFQQTRRPKSHVFIVIMVNAGKDTGYCTGSARMQ